MKSMDDVEMKVKLLRRKAGNLQLKYMPSGYTIMDIKTYIKGETGPIMVGAKGGYVDKPFTGRNR